VLTRTSAALLTLLIQGLKNCACPKLVNTNLTASEHTSTTLLEPLQQPFYRNLPPRKLTKSGITIGKMRKL
jgi:hypothetical protein